MKLILAIVCNDDSQSVSSALIREGFFVTKLSTTGGFLLVGNTTLLIGTKDEEVERAIDILKKFCTVRWQSAVWLPCCSRSPVQWCIRWRPVCFCCSVWGT